MTATIRNLDEALPKIRAPRKPPAPKRPKPTPRSAANEAMAKLLANRADHFFGMADTSSRKGHWNYASVYRIFGSRLEIARNAANPESFIRNLQKVFQSLSEELGMIADGLSLIAEAHPTKAEK